MAGEAAPSVWGFRALKQAVKLQCRMGRHEAMLATYERLLAFPPSGVTQAGLFDVIDVM